MGISTNSLVKVDLDEGRYRRARPLLATFGVILIAIACAAAVFHELALVSAVAVAGYGIAMIAAALTQRVAAIMTAVAAGSSVVLVIVTAVAAAHHTGGVAAFGLRDVLIFGGLGAASLLLLMWLHPDRLQGPEWRYRTDDEPRG
jgi:hypothetical protein